MISHDVSHIDNEALHYPAIEGQENQRGTLFEAEVKEYLLLKWQHQCAYCSATNTRLEMDHVHPRTKGGSNRVSNLVIGFRACNDANADQSIDTFLTGRRELVDRIQRQLTRRTTAATARNSTHWALHAE